MRILPLLLILVATAVHAEDHTWHVLIVTSDGKVSLIKGLTKFDAEHTQAKLQHYAYTKEEKAAEAKRRTEQEKAEAERIAAQDKEIRESNAACPDLSSALKIKDWSDSLNESDKIWGKWKSKHTDAQGCIKADGTVQRFGGYTQLNYYYGSGLSYKQIEVFQ